ncbi:MAG TPA: uroporphyrinogen-III synthase, partial [Spongiibacteraceae bacterium]|nr:uroporphyrinogen-III synthase [Spongiibacteraceae bacterium]
MIDASLQSLRVLVTRPEKRADTLIAQIAACGGEATHIPLLAVTPLNEHDDAAICAATIHRIRELDGYRRVIAISVNAVHFAIPWIKRHWSSVPNTITWYGIGTATIAAFADYGIIACGGDSSRSAMTSEALLASDELQNLHGEHILILRGVGGREQLATVLRARGALVDYAECYRRSEPTLTDAQRAQLQAMAFDAICVNSNETLQNLWQCLQSSARELACRIALIAPSERVAENARQLGFARVIIAADA